MVVVERFNAVEPEAPLQHENTLSERPAFKSSTPAMVEISSGR